MDTAAISFHFVRDSANSLQVHSEPIDEDSELHSWDNLTTTNALSDEIEAFTGGDGDFGLVSPTSFSNFNCFGIFVDYPDIDDGNACTNSSGGQIARPDAFFGLASISGGTATVTGKIRLVENIRFHVIAFQSNGVCPDGKSNVDGGKTSLSPPSLGNGVGQVRTIVSGQNNIELAASNTGRVDIKNCQGPLFNFASTCNGSTATNHLEIPNGSNFIICNPEQLNSLADGTATDMSKTYVLGRDIDMSGVTSKVIGKLNNVPFTGAFLGNNKSISNFSITGGTVKTGLFLELSGSGTIADLKLINHNVNGEGSVGGLVGSMAGGIIRNIAYQSGTVDTISATTVNTDIGGIVGSVTSSVNATIEKVVFSGAVSSSSTASVTNVGGIFGSVTNTASTTIQVKIQNVKVTGAVSGGSSKIGGIGGFITCSAAGSSITDIFDSYVTGNVTSNTAASKAGGLVGVALASTACNRVSVFRSYFSGTVSAAAATTVAGGLVGEANNAGAASDVSLRDSFFAGSVTNGATTSFGVGSVLNSPGTTNVAYHSGATCTSCTTAGTTFAVANVADFYSSSNPPMSTGTPWDFTNTWQEVAGAFPALRFETN